MVEYICPQVPKSKIEFWVMTYEVGIRDNGMRHSWVACFVTAIIEKHDTVPRGSPTHEIYLDQLRGNIINTPSLNRLWTLENCLRSF